MHPSCLPLVIAGDTLLLILSRPLMRLRVVLLVGMLERVPALPPQNPTPPHLPSRLVEVCSILNPWPLEVVRLVELLPLF